MDLNLPQKIIVLLVSAAFLVNIPVTGYCQEDAKAVQSRVHGIVDSRGGWDAKAGKEPISMDSGINDPAVLSGNPGVLSGITIQETAAEATITLDLMGTPDYSVVTALRNGKKWIDLYLHRFVTAMQDPPDEGKQIAGQILVMKNATKSDLRISIQIVPQGITYDIYQEENSLVVRLAPR